MRKYEAVCAGHICLDLMPDFTYDAQNIENVFIPGKLSMVGEMNIGTGGSVANTGLALEKMGVRTCLMGKAGNDELGSILGQMLEERYGVTDTVKKSAGEHTSYSVVISLPHTDRIFLHNPGANDTFTSDDIDMDIVSQVRLFHFGYPPAMKRMYQNGAAELIEMLRRVKRTGVATSLDMCPPSTDSGVSSEDWNKIIEKAAGYVDIILPSIEETAFILDRNGYEQIKKAAALHDIVDYIDLDYIAKLGSRLIDMGYKIVVLKCGKLGLYVKTAAAKELEKIGGRLIKNTRQWAQKEYFSGIYSSAKVKSAVGAGDTSIAGFLAAMLRGEGVITAIDVACAAGWLCVQTYSAVDGILPYEKIKQMLADGMNKKRNDYTGSYWLFSEEDGVFVPSDK